VRSKQREPATTRAREVLDVALRRFMPTPNLHYLSASLALTDGRCEDAITHYRRCLAYRGQVLVVPIQEGITSYVSLAGIAQCWLLRGDHRSGAAPARTGDRDRTFVRGRPPGAVAHLAATRRQPRAHCACSRLPGGTSGLAGRVPTDHAHPASARPDGPGEADG
jgi:hypothetical protein